MQAYIDAFEIITILTDKSIEPINKTFKIAEEPTVKLVVLGAHEEAWHYKYIVKYDGELKFHKDLTLIDESGNLCKLKSGSIVRTKEFEEKFYYDGPLGVEYTKKKSTFRIWSPVAKEIILILIDKKGKKKEHPLSYVDKGLWEIEISGDLDSYKYLYNIRIFDVFNTIKDPYAISSSANGEYNYVINPDKLYKIKHPKPAFSGKFVDAVIYEASVRDFTYNVKGNLQGTFLGMVENNPTKSGLPTGLDYVKYLGATHLQLLPTFDFAGVDDVNKNSKYNWGYNPEQYFIPNGWYSVDPNDPYSRINELLTLIDEAHKRGIRVTMDVVFNHVYRYEDFAFDNLVPGYFYRVEADGRLSNASCCGNDLATERKMCSRFVVDVLKYYTKMFDVSGYRFDLMGLLDIDTLIKAREVIYEIDDTIMLYGEGWNMQNPLPDEHRAHMYNHYKLPGYGYFNDRYRDFLRGSQWNHHPGYAFSGDCVLYDLFHLLQGSCTDYFKFDDPNKSINYVECHDNYTFYDYGTTFLKKEITDVLTASKLALQIILISQGVPFIHAGQEFFRTKQGVENSYKDKDAINKFDYQRRDLYKKNVTAIKDLIEIRKEYPELRLDNQQDIKNKVHLLEGLSDYHSITILIEGQEYNLYVLVKNNTNIKSFCLENGCMIYNSNCKCKVDSTVYNLKDAGVYIFKETR